MEHERSRINFEVYTALFLAAVFGLFTIVSPDDFSGLTLGSWSWWCLYLLPLSAIGYWSIAHFFRGELFSWSVMLYYSSVFIVFTFLVGIYDSRKVLLLSMLVLAGYSLGGSLFWLRRYRKTFKDDSTNVRGGKAKS